MSRDRGSTVPLILGFVIVALMVVAGAVAAGDAFVQQRDLQSVCDGAAAAAGASAADLNRNVEYGTDDELNFIDVQQAVDAYLARDPQRRAVQVQSQLSTDARTLSLTCIRTQPIAFGPMFGKGDGIRHIANAAARAPVT